jgi:single-strand DNA-binding protein
MPDLNNVTLAGRLARDPELRHTPSGAAVCEITVVNTRHYKKSDGQKAEETCFIKVTAWNRTAEIIAETLSTGRPVIVEGRLTQQEWEDKQSGSKRSKTGIQAHRVTPLDWDEGKSTTRPQPTKQTTADDDIPF